MSEFFNRLSFVAHFTGFTRSQVQLFQSPDVRSPERDAIRWSLLCYPHNKQANGWVSLYLRCQIQTHHPGHWIKAQFRFSVIGQNNDDLLLTRSFVDRFAKSGARLGCQNFIDPKTVSRFLVNDTLRVRVEIKIIETNFLHDYQLRKVQQMITEEKMRIASARAQLAEERAKIAEERARMAEERVRMNNNEELRLGMHSNCNSDELDKSLTIPRARTCCTSHHNAATF